MLVHLQVEHNLLTNLSVQLLVLSRNLISHLVIVLMLSLLSITSWTLLLTPLKRVAEPLLMTQTEITLVSLLRLNLLVNSLVVELMHSIQFLLLPLTMIVLMISFTLIKLILTLVTDIVMLQI